MFGDDGFELGRQVGKALGQEFTRVGLELAVADMAQAVTLSLDHAPPGGAQAGVEAEDDQASFSSSSSGTS